MQIVYGGGYWPIAALWRLQRAAQLFWEIVFQSSTNVCCDRFFWVAHTVEAHLKQVKPI